MRLYVPIFLLSSFMIAGCRKTENNLPSTNSAQTTAEQANAPSSSPAPAGQPAPATAAVKPKIDACALLTSQEIQSIQGEPLKETKLSGQSAGGFPVSQCFFTLPTFTNSISLLITQKAETAGARNPSEFWRETFHKERKEKGRDREREKEREEEEEESAPPQKITGIGDEAFWMGSRVGGALYVLKGNAYVRVSVGGPADQANKIKRSKALAQKVLARL